MMLTSRVSTVFQMVEGKANFPENCMQMRKKPLGQRIGGERPLAPSSKWPMLTQKRNIWKWGVATYERYSDRSY